ncbi:MAG: signal recognition particle-docking protein FtsY [Pseudomonadota bacterium]
MFGSRVIAAWRGRLRQLLSRSEEIPHDDLEKLLYEADFGAPIVERLIDAVERSKVRDPDGVLRLLRETTVSILREIPGEVKILPIPGSILLVGVNGVGKTTVAARLARRYLDEGKKVVLAAADTFRAGAIEQLKIWGGRIGAEVVAQGSGADPAAVVFDAWQRAVALGGVMVADTAGRMHTKAPLLEELKKIVKVLGKDGRGAPHEIYLILDGTTGQNAISQAKEFLAAVPVTGLVVTKLDGSAKGGATVASSLALSVPIRYVGVGEQAGDLVPFDPVNFSEELF